jgi:hypothetical protein
LHPRIRASEAHLTAAFAQARPVRNSLIPQDRKK